MGAEKLNSVTFNDCSDLPKYNFDKIREGDYRWLVVGFTGYNQVDVPDNAGELAFELENEYCKLIKDNSTIQYLEINGDITCMVTEYACVHALCQSLKPPCSIKLKVKIVDEINQWEHFNIDNNIGRPKLIKETERQLRSLHTRIERKRGELKHFTEGMEVINPVKQQVALERILKKNRIDRKVVTVVEWVELNKQAEEVVKAQKKWTSSKS